MEEENPLYISASGIIEFLLFQDRLNGLYRFLLKMSSPIEGYIAQRKNDRSEREEEIKNGPDFYPYGDFEFTKHEALLGLDFEEGYEGGTGSDTDFFPRYFYSSVLILSISLLESLVSEVIITAEQKNQVKYDRKKNNHEPFLFKAIIFLNEYGYALTLPIAVEKHFREINEIRNHFVHRLHEEDFGKLTEDKQKYDVTYNSVLFALQTVATIAKD